MFPYHTLLCLHTCLHTSKFWGWFYSLNGELIYKNFFTIPKIQVYTFDFKSSYFIKNLHVVDGQISKDLYY